MLDQSPPSVSPRKRSIRGRIVDWLGAQGSGNLTLYMISAVTAGAWIMKWLG